MFSGSLAVLLLCSFGAIFFQDFTLRKTLHLTFHINLTVQVFVSSASRHNVNCIKNIVFTWFQFATILEIDCVAQLCRVS